MRYPPVIADLRICRTSMFRATSSAAHCLSSFSALTKLRYFYVNDNTLTGGIPDSYTSLTEMVAFYLYNNQFSGSIYTGLLAGWTKLNYFYIHNNKFSGDFPSSIGSCPVLIGINASGNRFSTLPVGLLNLAVLAAADLNQQRDQIRAGICQPCKQDESHAETQQ